MEQPLPQCLSTNSVLRIFFPRVAIGCRLSLKIDRNLSPFWAGGGLIRGYMREFTAWIGGTASGEYLYRSVVSTALWPNQYNFWDYTVRCPHVGVASGRLPSIAPIQGHRNINNACCRHLRPAYCWLSIAVLASKCLHCDKLLTNQLRLTSVSLIISMSNQLSSLWPYDISEMCILKSYG